MQSLFRSTAQSWRNQPPAIRLIRLWLGVTWIYGGWDKAADPGFLSKTGRTYIGTQLTGYAHTSPLGFLFQPMIERAQLVGIAVILTEFAIGIATLFWIAPTFFAFLGFTMSTGLWIAATWHVKPYFLGSDTAYAILWLAYFLTLLGKRRKVELALDRRGAIRMGALGVAAIGATLLGNLFARPGLASATALAPATSGNAKHIIKLSKVAVGATHEFLTRDGQPAILFRTKNGVFAYSEVCTHQGCTVAYSAPNKTLVCPCHSAVYDPYDQAKVLSGPAPAPLPPIKVAINGKWIVFA